MTLTAPDRVGSSRSLAAPLVVVAGCVAVAIVSLPLPSALTFDAHAWLVWGREVGRLTLDTTGGPSWKPLPVLVTTVLAPLGTTLAPLAWTVVARTGALLAVAGTYRLASRAAGRAAGVIAAGVLVLAPDGDPRFLRLFAEGHIAPTTAACAVWAVDAHLDGRHRTTLALALAASLIRPEAWPFLLGYAVWSARRSPSERRLVVGALAAVPVLWFGGDWWGAGSPLEGAATAQVAVEDSVVARSVEALGVLVAVVVPVAWVAAVLGWRSATGRAERWLRAMAAGAALWAGLVVVMAAVLGYAALSRFFLPVAAVVAVLAGVGAARTVARLRSVTAHRRVGEAQGGQKRLGLGVPVVVVVVVLGVAAVALSVPRVASVPSVLDEAAAREPVEDDLDRVLDEVGRDRLLACRDLAVDGIGLLRMGVAWKLDVPVGVVGLDLDAAGVTPRGVMIMRTGLRRERAISRQVHTSPILRTDDWSVLAVNCPSALLDGDD